MTKQEVAARASGTYGRGKYRLEDHGEWYTKAARETAQAERRKHREAKPASPDILDLKAWPDSASVGEFRKAMATYKRAYDAWQKKDNQLLHLALAYRYSVVDYSSGVFGCCYTGDTWEEAARKARLLT